MNCSPGRMNFKSRFHAEARISGQRIPRACQSGRRRGSGDRFSVGIAYFTGDCDRLLQRDRHHVHFRLKFKVDPIEVPLPAGSAGAIRQDLPAPPLGRRLLGPPPRIARRFHVVAKRARQHVSDRNNASLVRIGKKACFACRSRRFVLTSLDPFDPRGTRTSRLSKKTAVPTVPHDPRGQAPRAAVHSTVDPESSDPA
jgi:hypothetical protein